MRDDPNAPAEPAARLRDLAARLRTALEGHARPHYHITHPDGRFAVVQFRNDGPRVYFDFAPNSTLTPCPRCRQQMLARSFHLNDAELFSLLQELELGLASCLRLGHTARPSIFDERIDVRPTAPPVPQRPAEPRIRIVPPAPAEPTPLEAPAPQRIVIAQRVPTAPVSGPNAASAPEVVYELPNGHRVTVLVSREVCEALIQHCRDSNRHGREVGGVLAGYKHDLAPDGQAGKTSLVIATDIIPVPSTDASGAHVRLDAEVWVSVNDRFDATYTPQGKVRLGWYHTHPTQGIFFSNLDLDAHTVFTSPHQFALVVDPRTMDAGLFFWEDYGQRRLAGPVRFSLRRERDWTDYTRAQGPGAAPDAAPAPEPPPQRPQRGPLDVGRLSLFGTAAVLGAGGAIWLTQPSLRSPDVACLLALTAVVGLRLWFAGVFHPAERLSAAPRQLPRIPPRPVPAGSGPSAEGRSLRAGVANLLTWSAVWQFLPYVAVVAVLVAVAQVFLWAFL
jgi:proteasome lid subunit RPN8/RPN11